MAAAEEKPYTTEQLQNSIRKQQELLARLRQDVLNVNKVVDNACSANTDVVKAKEAFKTYSDTIERCYETLEAETSQMYKSRERWNTREMNRLHALLLDALSDPNNAEIYERALKLCNSWDTTDHYINFTVEFLRAFGGTHNRHRTMPHITPDVMAATNEQLEAALNQVIDQQQSHQQQGRKFRPRWLERNAYGGLLEVRSVVTHQHQSVELVKFALIIHNGVYEFIQFMAPHEEWSYSYVHRKQIDLSVQSKYEYYRRLSSVANSVWLSNLASVPLHRALLICSTQLVTLEKPCRVCKKYLKNYSLPVLERQDRAVHDACR